MWIRAVVLVAAFSYVLADNIVPKYAECANFLFNGLQNDFTPHVNTLKTKANQIGEIVETKCVSNIAQQTQQQQQQQQTSTANLLQKVSILVAMVDGMDIKITEALAKVNAMDAAVRKTQEAAKTENVNNLNDAVFSEVNKTEVFLENKIGTLMRKTEVEALLNAQFREVKDTVDEVGDVCGSDAKLTEVLTVVQEVKGEVAKATTETEETKDEVTKCSTQNTVQQLGSVLTKMEALKNKMEAVETGLEEELQDVKEVLVDVYNNTQPPPPTTPPPTLPPGTLSACEDSTFQGNTAINVCGSAVRFDKCRLETVAYHCCHTCTSEGKIPAMGSWRYRHDERKVSTLDVIRFYAL